MAAAELALQLRARVTVLDAASGARQQERAESLRNRSVDVRLGWNQDAWSGDPPTLAVLSPGIPPGSVLGRLAAGLACPVAGELEFGFRHVACPVLAITGTNGKTTTTELLAACLKQAGKRVMAAGNIGVPLCEAARKSGQLDFLVVEVSSFQLETCERCAPLAAAVLNITPDQLDRVKQIHRLRYRDGLNRTQALERLATHELAATGEFHRVLAFAKASERGLAPGAR